ncbi:DUF6429 family protein [Ferrimonas pelagia]|uniref:DUF6429 domain-containing protein n=1 Tax=Ferrimonas pelagia TaxID=1177826 RepID=A0ABP9EH56_9GAMM
MSIPEHIDQDKLAEVALAILALSARDDKFGTRAWKGMDWALTDLLYEKGWIGDPKGKQKSVVFTEEGAALAELYLQKHFSK